MSITRRRVAPCPGLTWGAGCEILDVLARSNLPYPTVPQGLGAPIYVQLGALCEVSP